MIFSTFACDLQLGLSGRIHEMSASHSKHQRQREGLFFIAMAVAMALVVFVGFAQSFFLFFWLEPDSHASLHPIYYVHGVVFTAWMALLIVQPTLIRLGRVTQHRKLGWLGVGLAIGVAGMGILVAVVAFAPPEGSTSPLKDLESLGVTLFGIVMFSLLVGFAVACRHHAQYHKRFMLLATVNLLQAAVTRIPLDLIAIGGSVGTFLLADVFILPLVVWDVCVLRRIHPATLWGGLAILVSLPLRFWLSETQLWLSLAGWTVGLVH